MIVGFTGTRNGMTKNQAATVTEYLLKATEAHHGDCVGADEQFHAICLELGIPVVIHPPSDQKLRAFCHPAKSVMLAAQYLERDRHIVDACELLIAAPKEGEEPAPARGQGTWYTVRYARRVGKQFRIAWPGTPWLVDA